MIALLAAVHEETRLIRQSCQNLHPVDKHGLEFWVGSFADVSICLAHTGVGKAAASAAATSLALSFQPSALWQFGCGGAYPCSGLRPGDLALADLEIFGDEGVATASGFQSLAEMDLVMRQTKAGPLFNAWPVNDPLTAWAEGPLRQHCAKRKKGFLKGPFLTVSCCTGTSELARTRSSRANVICENMEGAAVALACHQLGIPFLEFRGISNLVEPRNTQNWDLAAGMVTAQKAVLALLGEYSEG
ncbi:MAG: futalosine hydrolase [Deltaproteobacteria bacterium]|jgi:futalosine hydrolase|nr:futalosine hydrolase [Deltaproteobacteria bacterium]